MRRWLMISALAACALILGALPASALEMTEKGYAIGTVQEGDTLAGIYASFKGEGLLPPHETFAKFVIDTMRANAPRTIDPSTIDWNRAQAMAKEMRAGDKLIFPSLLNSMKQIRENGNLRAELAKSRASIQMLSDTIKKVSAIAGRVPGLQSALAATKRIAEANTAAAKADIHDLTLKLSVNVSQRKLADILVVVLATLLGILAIAWKIQSSKTRPFAERDQFSEQRIADLQREGGKEPEMNPLTERENVLASRIGELEEGLRRLTPGYEFTYSFVDQDRKGPGGIIIKGAGKLAHPFRVKGLAAKVGANGQLIGYATYESLVARDLTGKSVVVHSEPKINVYRFMRECAEGKYATTATPELATSEDSLKVASA